MNINGLEPVTGTNGSASFSGSFYKVVELQALLLSIPRGWCSDFTACIAIEQYNVLSWHAKSSGRGRILNLVFTSSIPFVASLAVS